MIKSEALVWNLSVPNLRWFLSVLLYTGDGLPDHMAYGYPSEVVIIIAKLSQLSK